MNPIFKVILLLLLLLLILLLFDIFTKNKLLVEKNAGRKGFFCFFVGFCFAKYTFLKPCGLVLVLFVNFKYWGTEFD